MGILFQKLLMFCICFWYTQIIINKFYFNSLTAHSQAYISTFSVSLCSISPSLLPTFLLNSFHPFFLFSFFNLCGGWNLFSSYIFLWMSYGSIH